MLDEDVLEGRELSCERAYPCIPAIRSPGRRCPPENVRKILTIPSFPKVTNRFGYTGSRFQGNKRAFNILDAKSYQDHIAISGKLPFPMNEGEEIFPQDIQEAISFMANKSSEEMLEFWQTTVGVLAERAYVLMPQLVQMRNELKEEELATRARLHLPLLAELLEQEGMGGEDWLAQFCEGFPMIGTVGEPGVYPANSHTPKPISREELFRTAKDRWKPGKKPDEAHRAKLWEEAMTQTEKGWLSGPHRYSKKGRLRVGQQKMSVNPAYRFGVQQAEKLRAVDDLKRSRTNEATAVTTPINLPSWDHIANMCIFFRKQGETRPLAMAKADHADAYKQLPLKAEDEQAAVVTLQSPEDGKWYGFIPKTQLFGSTAAVLHYNCLSRVIASLACRILKLPCVGYYDDFAIIAPRLIINKALEAFTMLDDLLLILLKKNKSESGRILEFLGITIHFAVGFGETIATLQFPEERIRKQVELVGQLANKTYISLAELQKAAGKLCFAQTMIMGRFGKAAMRPLYEMIAQGGGSPSPAFRAYITQNSSPGNKSSRRRE